MKKLKKIYILLEINKINRFTIEFENLLKNNYCKYFKYQLICYLILSFTFFYFKIL